MKLYLISQTENNDYDTYDSAVVAADTEEQAKKIHPNGVDYATQWGYSWASSPNQVTAEYIGEAKEGTVTGVICASFNAG